MILYEIVLALDYLSRRGITHRDLKPANIFVHDGIHRIGDFGFATTESKLEGEIGTITFM